MSKDAADKMLMCAFNACHAMVNIQLADAFFRTGYKTVPLEQPVVMCLTQGHDGDCLWISPCGKPTTF